MAADYAFVRAAGSELPGTEEGTSYGTPALKVQKKLFARLANDGVTLVLRTTFDDRDFLLSTDPAVFYITDHYRNYPWVLVRLAKVRRAQMRELLELAWRCVASKKLLAELDARQG